METEVSVQTEDWMKLADPELKTAQGWIDHKGNFYPCEYGGHCQLLYDMQEAGFLKDLSYNEAENYLVKSSGGNIFSFCQNLTSRQKLTVEVLIKKHDMLENGREFIVGNYVFFRNDERVTSRLFSED